MKFTLLICLIGISNFCIAQLDKKENKALHKWLSAVTKAAENGNTDSMEVLGQFYSNEFIPFYVVPGSLKNPFTNFLSSQKWFRECGAFGNANCNYQIGIALINLNGYEKADSTIYFLKKAANAGNVKAMYWLGYKL